MKMKSPEKKKKTGITYYANYRQIVQFAQSWLSDFGRV